MSEHKEIPAVAMIDGVVDRFDRINRRLIAIIVLLIVLLVGSNVFWIVYENSFEDWSMEVEQESDEGTNNFIGEDGFIINK